MFKERIYKIWKQFTTEVSHLQPDIRLCSKNEYTKSESNSQHRNHIKNDEIDCVQRTNIQNLKAIHNTGSSTNDLPRLCSKNEYTKSESNSQPRASEYAAEYHCVQRTNIQNLKAIHNSWLNGTYSGDIVFKERIYKIWKQFTTRKRIKEAQEKLCSKNEYTKSESNSQHLRRNQILVGNCVQRTNIQNLKAIHNCEATYSHTSKLCSKNEYTKSESNSQRTGTPIWLRPGGGCMCSGCGASLFWNGLTISLRSYHETTRLS